jgi:hypothetical protein
MYGADITPGIGMGIAGIPDIGIPGRGGNICIGMGGIPGIPGIGGGIIIMPGRGGIAPTAAPPGYIIWGGMAGGRPGTAG